MTVKPVDLTASEALFAFAAWLTTRDEVTILSAQHSAAPIAKLVGDFVAVNCLAEPRGDFNEHKTRHPVYPDNDELPKYVDEIECPACSYAADAGKSVCHPPPACPDETSIELAWVVIANATDWNREDCVDWRVAAERWRDRYMGEGAKR